MRPDLDAETRRMSEAEQFKKAPRRKGDRGRNVKLSPEAKQAYADLINERIKSHNDYGKHLPATTTKR